MPRVTVEKITTRIIELFPYADLFDSPMNGADSHSHYLHLSPVHTIRVSDHPLPGCYNRNRTHIDVVVHGGEMQLTLVPPDRAVYVDGVFAATIHNEMVLWRDLRSMLLGFERKMRSAWPQLRIVGE